MGSYFWKNNKLKTVLPVILIGILTALIILSLFLSGKSYYNFVTHTPIGIMLHLAAAFRYMGDVNIAIALDISYILILVALIISVGVSFKKINAIKVLLVVYACDILLNLIVTKSIVSIAGDVLLIILSMLLKYTRER